MTEVANASADPEVGQSIDVDGVATNYHDHGEGHALVLLHGSGPGVSAWANWRANIPVLSERFRVVAPDVLGFGFTDKPDGITYTLEKWRNHLVGFLDALELEKVSIVGNSFGGALALSYADHYPSRVERLVLMGSAGLEFEVPEPLREIWRYEPSVESMKRLLDIMAFDRSLVTDDLAEMRFKASTRKGSQEAYSTMFPDPSQASLARLATPEERIALLEHECLIIHGREDRVLPIESSYRLFDLLQRSQLHAFARCGHWTQIEQRDRFNALVAEFIQEGLEG